MAARLPVRCWDHWKAEIDPLFAGPIEPVERFLPSLQLHVESFVQQGVTHAELMVGGLVDPAWSPADVVERFRTFQRVADVASGGAVEISFIVPLHRRRDPALTEPIAERLEAAARAGAITGIAICGRESAGPIGHPDWRPLLERIWDTGLGVEIHAGEFGGPESILDAVTHGRPDRLGHAVRAFEDENLVAELRDRDIHIEFCPSSNLRLGAIPSIEQLPIARARELGMNFSFNTDDPGPFECTMASERDLLARTFGFGTADFETIRVNALRSRFGTPAPGRASRGQTRKRFA